MVIEGVAYRQLFLITLVVLVDFLSRRIAKTTFILPIFIDNSMSSPLFLYTLYHMV